MIPVLVVMLWMYTGLYVIIFLANLQRIDVSVIEASKIDGASEAQVLRRIILPALSGVIVTSAILAISGSLKSFDLIYTMTNGGPANQTRVLSLYMYFMAFQGAPNYPLANANGIIEHKFFRHFNDYFQKLLEINLQCLINDTGENK